MRKEQKFIWDPVFKRIDIDDEVIKKLLFAKEFQRLKWIVQLGGSQFFFPGATHTRFSHSLGTYYLVKMALQTVSGSDKIKAKIKLHLKIAALLHDLGHGPFSHVFEYITDNFNHLKYTLKVINYEKSEIHYILKEYGIDFRLLENILLKKDKDGIIFGSLISGQFDCDRLDYLLRDSYFTGTDYGKIDWQWLLVNLEYNADNGFFFRSRAIDALEGYLFARFNMYRQIYHHPKNLLFEVILKKIFLRLRFLLQAKSYFFKTNLQLWKEIILEKDLSIDLHFLLTDISLISFLKELKKKENDKILLFLLNLFFKNNYEDMIFSDKKFIFHQKLTFEEKLFFYSEKEVVTMFYDKKEPIKIAYQKNENNSFYLKHKKLEDVSLFLQQVTHSWRSKLFIFLKKYFNSSDEKK